MALKPIVAKDKDGMFLAEKKQIRKILVEWIDQLAAGNPTVALSTIARSYGFSPRRIRKLVREDQTLQDEVFGTLTAEAQFGLTKAMARGNALLESEEADPAEVRKWGEFFARYIGGGFQKQGAGNINVGMLQMVSNISLPAGFKRADARVIDDEEARRRLGEAAPGETPSDGF